jgi:pimeloyl-ACP methyl ester carboxylesterase
MLKVTSADGTAIAYERSGSGAPVILVGGALCDRASFRPYAKAMEADCTVVTYDRRGRGDSGDTDSYAVDREVEDLGALITALGGTAAAYGHSSGAALVVEGAATGLPITKMALHEPPYGQDDEESRRHSDEAGAKVLGLLAEGRQTAAVHLFLTMAGMPEEAAAGMAGQPGMAEIAHTLAYDFAVMGNASPGGTVPFDLLGKLTQPTVAICGTASAPFMIEATRAVCKALPAGRLAELDGQQHAVPPEVLAPVLVDFFTS